MPLKSPRVVFISVWLQTRTLNFFKDMTKAPVLLFKGRLKLFPSFKGRKMEYSRIIKITTVRPDPIVSRGFLLRNNNFNRESRSRKVELS